VTGCHFVEGVGLFEDSTKGKVAGIGDEMERGSAVRGG
jgi:hypothetical protein